MIVKKAEGRMGGRPAGRGHSFKALAAYMLNPKDNATERVVWHAIENVGTDNAHMAARVMAATAKNADAIKAKAGTGRAGRKSEHGAVLHLVMSWPEDQEPTPEHQHEAARDLLKALGMESAQAVLAAHDDNGKPHVHLMVNLIDPATGKQFSLSNDQRRMSDWALAYEQANGGVRCQQRADNADRRAKGEPTKDATSLSRPEWEQMQASARQSWQARREKREAAFSAQAQARADLRAQHSAEWKAAKAEAAAHKRAHDELFRAALNVAKAADKATNKPVWRDVFRRHRAETISAVDALSHAEARLRGQAQITGRARAFLKVAERFERSVIARKVLKPLGFDVSADRQRAIYADAKKREAEARAGVTSAAAIRAALPAKQEAERKALAGQLSAATLAKVRAAVQAVNPVDFTAMIERQDAERARLIEAQNTEREALGMKPYQPWRKEADQMETKQRPPREAFKAAAPQTGEGWKADNARRQFDAPGLTKGTTPAAPVDPRKAMQAQADAAKAKAASPEGKKAAEQFKAASKRKDQGPSL